MEQNASKKTINLLIKFSNCINILSYFGLYHQSKHLMQILSKSTSETWSMNEKSFEIKTQPKSRRTIFIENFTHRNRILKDGRYLKYSFDIRIKEAANFDEFIEAIKLVGDIFDLQIAKIEILDIDKEEMSRLLGKLMDVLKSKYPEFSLPITSIDERLERNKKSIFHFLNKAVYKCSEKYSDQAEAFRIIKIMDQKKLKAILKYCKHQKDQLILCANGLHYPIDISDLYLVSNYDEIQYMLLSCSYFLDEKHPNKVLSYIMNIFLREESWVDNLQNFNEFYLYSRNITVCNIKSVLKTSEFMDEYNKSIEESKNEKKLPILQNIYSCFGEIVDESKNWLSLLQENSFMLININFTSFCIKFDSFNASILYDYDLVYYSDESIYVFKHPTYFKLNNARLVDRDHFINARFEELLRKADPRGYLKDENFFLIFNYGFKHIKLNGIWKVIFPSFRDVDSVHIDIDYKTFCYDDEKWIEEIAEGTTYFSSMYEEINFKRKIGDSSLLDSKLFLKIKNSYHLTQNTINVFSYLPIFSLYLMKLNLKFSKLHSLLLNKKLYQVLNDDYENIKKQNLREALHLLDFGDYHIWVWQEYLRRYEHSVIFSQNYEGY